ncbi:hypothetical protein ACI3E1_07125 [Ligilactobacillus sp. LYQ139]|uniref:hypothetical protein n=1 Tax=Ligilactobacillus sp. LYQ139 TaxID=3378800 RepID=UPI003852A30C
MLNDTEGRLQRAQGKVNPFAQQLGKHNSKKKEAGINNQPVSSTSSKNSSSKDTSDVASVKGKTFLQRDVQKSDIQVRADGTYILDSKGSPVPTSPRSIAFRRDLLQILDKYCDNGKGSKIRGLVTTIASNGVIRELESLGVINHEDAKRELNDYRSFKMRG